MLGSKIRQDRQDHHCCWVIDMHRLCRHRCRIIRGEHRMGAMHTTQFSPPWILTVVNRNAGASRSPSETLRIPWTNWCGSHCPFPNSIHYEERDTVRRRPPTGAVKGGSGAPDPDSSRPALGPDPWPIIPESKLSNPGQVLGLRP